MLSPEAPESHPPQKAQPDRVPHSWAFWHGLILFCHAADKIDLRDDGIGVAQDDDRPVSTQSGPCCIFGSLNLFAAAEAAAPCATTAFGSVSPACLRSTYDECFIASTTQLICPMSDLVLDRIDKKGCEESAHLSLRCRIGARLADLGIDIYSGLRRGQRSGISCRT